MPSSGYSSNQDVQPGASRVRLLVVAALVMVLLSIVTLLNITLNQFDQLEHQAHNTTTDHARQLSQALQTAGLLQCQAIRVANGLQLPDTPDPLISSALAARPLAVAGSTPVVSPDWLNSQQISSLQQQLGQLQTSTTLMMLDQQLLLVSRCNDQQWAISQTDQAALVSNMTTSHLDHLQFALTNPTVMLRLPANAPRSQPLAQAPLGDTGWQLQVYETPGYLLGELTKRLSSPLILILVMSLALLTSFRLLKASERVARQAERQRQQAEERADLVLQSIEDALISTDPDGHISYYNQQAAKLFTLHGKNDPLGQPLAEIWPHPRALWTHGLNARELEALHDQGRTLSVVHNGETRVLEQNYRPLYRDQQLDGIVWLLRDISTSVRTRRELELSRQRYMSLFEEAGVAHWLLDVSNFDGSLGSLSLVNANQAAVVQSGANNRPQLQLQFDELFPDSGDVLIELLQQILADQPRLVEGDLQIRRFDGQLRDLSGHFSSGFDHQIMVSMIDVTEKKRSAQRTREQEAFWAAVMAAMPDTVLVANLDDRLAPRLLYCNRSAAETLGFPQPLDHLHYDWEAHIASDDYLPALRRSLQQVRQLNSSQTLIHRSPFRHKDGSERVIRFEYTPFHRDSERLVDRYICTARDVTEEITKQRQIADSEARYRLVAENMTNIVWSTDTRLRFTFISSSIERLLGYSPQELQQLGVGAIFNQREIRQLFREFKHSIQVTMQQHHEITNRNVLIQQDIQARSKNGQRFVLELQASLLWDDNGEMAGILGVCRDVTETRQTERELLLAADVFENTNEAILVTDDKFRIVKVNRAFTHITGFTADEIIGHSPQKLLDDEHRSSEYLQGLLEILMADNYWQGELQFRCANGEVRTSWTGISIIRDQARNIQSLTIIMSDITERKVIEERIHKLAYYDSLTGLSNRTQLHERLDIMMRMADNTGNTIALLFIDLDRFKPINDSLGHPAGDRILVEVANRLRLCVKSSDLVSRMGGDEFTVCLNFRDGNDDLATVAQQVAERILKELNRPYYLDKHQLFLSASIGIAIYPTDAGSVTELLKNADMAMYHAKDFGRNNLQFFDEDMNRRAVERMQLENDLHQVIQRKELYLMFQPQFDSRSLTAVGVETLLRWEHSSRGDIPPQEFIPILEDTGLIVPVGRWVLEQSCLHMAKWLQEGSPVELIAVNVSARQFKHPNFVNEVKNAIDQAKISAHHLELELTESILIDDIDYTLALLHELRELGVRIAIDDFGTGYSSLNYLKQFPVDMLKIDKSFIQNLPANRSDAQITRTIIAMAHNLGLGVIAEGVENCDQLEFLVRSRCEKIQGFILSRPAREEDLKAQLNPEPLCCAVELRELQRHNEE
ncbi:sensor domain-containing protein [Oceanobacter mangrovi]|uniref:sensor domain-containing protein n=1 Tax=Oceanobacter mangrovi TaxID=2862510 RepID=UPI001C8DA004|nr:EAL domain-containing protein [Oceanobacter mangrovi]